MSEYYKMPALYKLDDYDKCMLELPNQRSTYCLVKTVIKPDNDSEIWKIVQVNILFYLNVFCVDEILI